MSITQKGSLNLNGKEKDAPDVGSWQTMGKDGSSYTQNLIDDEEDEEDDAIALELDDDMDEEDDSSEGSEDMTVEFNEDDVDEDDNFIEEGEDMVIEANETDLGNTLLDEEEDEEEDL